MIGEEKASVAIIWVRPQNDWTISNQINFIWLMFLPKKRYVFSSECKKITCPENLIYDSYTTSLLAEVSHDEAKMRFASSWDTSATREIYHKSSTNPLQGAYLVQTRLKGRGLFEKEDHLI